MTKEYNAAVSSLGSILRETSQHMPMSEEGQQAQEALATQTDNISASRDRWGWSVDKDPETWCGSFYSREDAIADATLHSYKEFYVVSGTCPDGSEYVPSASTILDMIGESASDAASEAAEDFPAVSKEAEEELDTLLADWSKKHLGVCDFWITSGEPEKIVLES